MKRPHPTKRPTSLTQAGTLLLALVGATGCLDIDFEPQHLVQTPRILAISADPGESEFGSDVRFSALIRDSDGSDLLVQDDVELRWTVCLSTASIIRASGLGFGMSLDDNCAEGGDDLYVLTTEGLPSGEALLPGAAFLQLAASLPMGGTMPPDGGGLVDPMLLETLTTVLGEVGIPLRVRLEVRRAGELILRGFKRFAIVARSQTTTNPPPPRFAVDGVWLSARVDGGNPRFCVPEDGARPVVAAGAEVELTPDPEDEIWMEEYPVFNLTGELQTNQESAYYSWFTTAGELSGDITQAPLRDLMWTAPEVSGVYPFWLVVRDGHYGIVWCQAEIEVE